MQVGKGGLPPLKVDQIRRGVTIDLGGGKPTLPDLHLSQLLLFERRLSADVMYLELFFALTRDP
jgi:hypothetical protein